MTLPSPLRLLTAPTPRMSVSAFFAVTGFISSTWIARIPAATRKLDLDTAQLGTLLLFIAVGSLVAFQFIGRIIEGHGSARSSVRFGAGFVVALSLLAPAPAPAMLGVALFSNGFAFGAVDVAMNAQGVTVERRVRKPIMGSLHGFFSLAAGRCGAERSRCRGRDRADPAFPGIQCDRIGNRDLGRQRSDR